MLSGSPGWALLQGPCSPLPPGSLPSVSSSTLASPSFPALHAQLPRAENDSGHPSALAGTVVPTSESPASGCLFLSPRSASAPLSIAIGSGLFLSVLPSCLEPAHGRGELSLWGLRRGFLPAARNLPSPAWGLRVAFIWPIEMAWAGPIP